MATDSQSKVFKALESTESLLASLLGSRSSLPSEPIEDTDGGHPIIDVEQSLLGVGERLLDTPHLIRQGRQSEADPRDTLTSIVTRSVRASSSTTSLTSISLEEQLQQKENELEITAKLGLALLERKEFLEREVTRLTDQSVHIEHSLLQARHELGQKDSLLQLYYVQEEQRDDAKELLEPSPPEWVRTLTKERTKLKEDNQKLWTDNQELEKEAQKNIQKSQALVKQCVDQLTEAKHELIEVQMDMDRQTNNTIIQQKRSDKIMEENMKLMKSNKQFEDDLDETRERLTDSMLVSSQLTAELTDWSEKYETCYIMLQDAKEETKMLKDLTNITNGNRSGVHTPSSEAEHGSIVSEIEAVLRQEILAASTLDERPPSPSSYARQRTMVVMETVKAATLATAKKLEKLAEEQRKNEGQLLHPVPVESSDSHRPKYISPQKLQIVKPMEGSATLLQWKILATPKLGGTPSFFSKSDRPGIKLKNLDSPSSATPTVTRHTPIAHNLTVNSIQNNKRWNSTSDISRHRINNSPAISHKNYIRPPPTTNGGLSTVDKVRQNFMGLFTSPGKNIKSKSSQGQGLEELLS